MMDKEELGKLIKSRRENKGWSQAQLAEKCGWDSAAGRISNYENGSREPSISDLEKIARAFHLHLKEFLFEEDAPIISHDAKNFVLVPHFEWKNHQLDHFLKACLNGHSLSNILKKIGPMFVKYPGEGHIPEYLFSMTVVGNAMEPRDYSRDGLSAGDKVFIDPKAIPSSHSIVFAKIEGHYLLRQFIQDGTQYYLKPLNPDPQYKIIKLTNLGVIRGVVTDIWRKKQKEG